MLKSIVTFGLLCLFGVNALSNEVVKANPAIKVMANGMTLLKPIFAAEAKLQANLLGSKVDSETVSQEIAEQVKSSPIVVYTYGLSPFSSEAVALLQKTGYEFEEIEVGPEWFLLNGANSVKRVLLSEMVENGATSLPKVFVKGNCIGGCAELANLVESGELGSMMESKKPAFMSFWQ